MKKSKWVVWSGVAVLVLALGYLTASLLSGGALYAFGLPLGGDRGELRRLAFSFWEDVQFKDFDTAASYHEPDRSEEVDIPDLIERLFLQKPEFLDITDIEVMMVDVDSSGDRGRVRTQMRVHDLIKDEWRDQEVMLYYHREAPGSPWYMELETSLRQIEGEEGKVF